MKNAKHAALSAWRAHVTLRAMLLIGLLMIALIGLSSFAFWQGLELKGFDLLTVLFAQDKPKSPIALVVIDDDSLEKLKQTWPLPRSMHGRLIDALNKDGAAVIAFDMEFDSEGKKEEDKALAGAIKQAGNVVLASSLVQAESYTIEEPTNVWTQETPSVLLKPYIKPLPLFTENKTAVGYINIAFDPDRVLRRIPDREEPFSEEPFWRAIADNLREIAPKLVGNKGNGKLNNSAERGAMIRYVDPAQTFPRISYYDALNHLKPAYIRDRVVIVGLGKIAASNLNPPNKLDIFFETPFTTFNGNSMAEMEVHANILESVLNGQTINPAPMWTVNLLLLGTLLLTALLMRRFHPVVSALSVAVLIAVLAWALFTYFNIWLPAGVSVLGIVLLYVSQPLLTLTVRSRITDQSTPTGKSGLTPTIPVAKITNEPLEENPLHRQSASIGSDNLASASPMMKNTSQAKPLRIFISYSHKQNDYYPLFKSEFIDFAKFPGLSIEIIGDDELPLGSIWHDFLQEKVALCDAMVLLVSQAFLNSQYIREHEFGEAINRLKKGKNICIIPVYFAPCRFENDEELAKLQFFKPRGDDYGCRDISDFSYTDLVDRSAGKVVENSTPGRERYMKALAKKMEPELLKLANAIAER